MSNGLRSRRQGREFGLVVGSALLVLAGLVAWRGADRTWCAVAAGTGIVLAALGWLAPSSLERPARLWLAVAERLALVGNAILLVLVFFLVVTPVGLVMRLVGHDPLSLRGKKGTSAWVPCREVRSDPRHFERMY